MLSEWTCRSCGRTFLGTVDTPCPQCGSMDASHPELRIQWAFLAIAIIVLVVRTLI